MDELTLRNYFEKLANELGDGVTINKYLDFDEITDDPGKNKVLVNKEKVSRNNYKCIKNIGVHNVLLFTEQRKCGQHGKKMVQRNTIKM